VSIDGIQVWLVKIAWSDKSMVFSSQYQAAQVPRESKHDVTKRQELLCMQQQEREAGKGDMSAAHTCRMPGSAAEQLPIALSVGIKGQAVPTAADLSAS